MADLGPQGPTPDASQATPGANASGASSISLTPDQISAMVASAVQASVSQIVQNLNVNRQRQPSEPESQKAKALISANSSLPKLQDGTYSQWAFAVSDLVRVNGLSGHLDGSAAQPDGTDRRALDKWEQEDGTVRATIISSLDPAMSHHYLEGTTTARQAWEALERHYKTSNAAALMAIDKQLADLRMAEGGNVIDHIVTLKNLKRRLDGSDFEVNEARAKAILFRSLPPSYKSWIVWQEESTPVPAFDKLCLMLESLYRGQTARSGQSSSSVAAFPAKAHFSSSSSVSPASVFASLVPTDLRIPLTGNRNPALSTRAGNTCKDCHNCHNPRF
ncbi:Copia-like polyprotein/retrotransposon [Ceratobasidium sp. AG-Ba]|nr:Copia-like polyprotein/retrotransposon [Ceratobasidium sp. AG-Ba]